MLTWPVKVAPSLRRVLLCATFEIHFDDAASHQLDQRPVRVATLKNGNQWVGPRHHGQEDLGHDSFAAARFRHKESVGIGQGRIEGREGNELSRRSFHQDQGRIGCATPGHLDRQQVSCIRCQQLDPPHVLTGHRRQAAEEHPFLRQHFGDAACAVHARQGVQHLLTAVCQYALGLLPLRAVARRLRASHPHDQAELASLARARDDVLQHFDELTLAHLGVNVHAKAAVDVALRREHLPQPALVLLHYLDLIRQAHFGIENQGKIHSQELPQDTGEGGVGQVLERDPGMQQAADLQVIIELVLDIDVGHLAARAFINK